MADQWNIHKGDGSEIGPLTPLEVRDALRDGSVEPFDLVSRVGSKIKLPLVEVDEIFLSADEAEKAKVDSIYDKNGPFSEKEEATVASTPIKMASNMSSAASAAQTAVSRPEAPSYPKAKSAAKRHAKKYFLVDKKKRYNGPLSAPEIQSLFSRGLLPPGVFVVKDRNGPRIPAQQFVSAYLGAKAKKLNTEVTKFDFDALAQSKRVGLPSSKDMDLWARTVAQQAYIAPQRFPYMTAFLIIVAIIILSILAQNYLIPRLYNGKTNAVSEQTLEVVPNTNIEEVKPRPSTATEASEVVSAGGEHKEPTASSKPKALKSKPEPAKKKASRPQTMRSATQPAYTAPKLPIYGSGVRQPTVAPVSKGYTAGQQASVSATFSPAALDSCGLKCTLSVKDSAGKSLDVIFFKGQYEDNLKKKAGRATFGGRIDIQGSRTILYLQSVR